MVRVQNTQFHDEVITRGGLTVVRGTHDIADILSSVYSFIIRNRVQFQDETEQILKNIRGYFTFAPCFEEEEDLAKAVYYGKATILEQHRYDATEFFIEQMTFILDSIAPEGYSFMSHPGSSSDYGYYRNDL